eukprot:Nk52_evm41s1569 gene=Nk52_evmTU41s1569
MGSKEKRYRRRSDSYDSDSPPRKKIEHGHRDEDNSQLRQRSSHREDYGYGRDTNREAHESRHRDYYDGGRGGRREYDSGRDCSSRGLDRGGSMRDYNSNRRHERDDDYYRRDKEHKDRDFRRRDRDDRHRDAKDGYRDDKDSHSSCRDEREKKSSRRKESGSRKEEKSKKKKKEKRTLSEDEDYDSNEEQGETSQSGFTWKKKMDAQRRKGGLSKAEIRRLEDERKRENELELEKVKKRKREREIERELQQQENDRIAREREMAKLENWEEKEEQFHLEQARLRSKLRMEQGRPKPIDVLSTYLSSKDKVDDLDISEPYVVLEGLDKKEIDELIVDIKLFMGLDGSDKEQFWKDMMLLCEDKIRAQSESGVSGAVQTDVSAVFKNKTYEQLVALQKSIKAKFNSTEAIDVKYWEGLLEKLKVEMATARLRNFHEEILREKMVKLRELKREEELEQAALKKDAAAEEEVGADREDLSNTETRTPLLSSASAVRAAEENEERIKKNKEEVIKMLKAKQLPKYTNAEEKLFREEAAKAMEEDEEVFNLDELIDNADMQELNDSAKGRKPRFFNRVLTGYEWNQYNRTHYDADNPPPKVIKGYKFNIFYPDLLDPTNAPSYSISPCPDTKEFCILRFHSGPPYEDIAFKIIIRDWEYSHKKGFRCQFDKGVFQLWFRFQRLRYRR